MFGNSKSNRFDKKTERKKLPFYGETIRWETLNGDQSVILESADNYFRFRAFYFSTDDENQDRFVLIPIDKPWLSEVSLILFEVNTPACEFYGIENYFDDKILLFPCNVYGSYEGFTKNIVQNFPVGNYPIPESLIDNQNIIFLYYYPNNQENIQEV